MKQPIYLDNNATTPVDPAVADAMDEVTRNHYGNPASKTHSQGWYAEELVQIAREEVAALINAKADEIIFTSGATEANNLVIKGVAAALQRMSSFPVTIISAATEHRSILDSFEQIVAAGHEVLLLPISGDGTISLDDYEEGIAEDGTLVSLMFANNEIGVVHEIKELARIARQSGTFFHCDATQAVGKIPVDVAALQVDYLTLSAHKIYGPKGVGALYWAKELGAPQPDAQLHGGGHEQGLRSGTLNVAGIVGFGKACKLAKERLQNDAKNISALTEQLYSGLSSRVSGITLNGAAEPRIPGNLNLRIDGIDNSRLVGMTNTKLAYSVSSACTSQMGKASHVLEAIGLSEKEQRSSIRLGVGRFNTKDEINAAVDVLADAITAIRGSHA